jgi:hypothetical protein
MKNKIRLLPLLFNIILEVQARAMRWKEERQAEREGGREEEKNSD